MNTPQVQIIDLTNAQLPPELAELRDRLSASLESAMAGAEQQEICNCSGRVLTRKLQKQSEEQQTKAKSTDGEVKTYQANLPAVDADEINIQKIAVLTNLLDIAEEHTKLELVATAEAKLIELVGKL